MRGEAVAKFPLLLSDRVSLDVETTLAQRGAKMQAHDDLRKARADR